MPVYISKNKRWWFVLNFFLAYHILSGQQLYSTANGHAHNDYRYNRPFVQAHALGFGSIEVDVLLIKDTLFVGHDLNEARKGITFEAAYIAPLRESLQKNNGYPYTDTTKKLLLLIDLKTESSITMNAVVSILDKYPEFALNR